MYFISYTHKNKPEAEAICEVFKKAGYEVWFDSGLRIGASYNLLIAENIQKCDCVVAIFSQDYFQSMYCRQELVYAREKLHKPVLPIVIEKNLVIPPDIDMLMVGINQFFMVNGIDEDALIRELKKLKGDNKSREKAASCIISDVNGIPSSEKKIITDHFRQMKLGRKDDDFCISIRGDKVENMHSLLQSVYRKIDDGTELTADELQLEKDLPGIIRQFEKNNRIKERACMMLANDDVMVSYFDVADLVQTIQEIATMDYYGEVNDKRNSKEVKYILLDCYSKSDKKKYFFIPIEEDVILSVLRGDLDIDKKDFRRFLYLLDIMVGELPREEIRKILKYLYYGLAEKGMNGLSPLDLRLRAH